MNNIVIRRCLSLILFLGIFAIFLIIFLMNNLDSLPSSNTRNKEKFVAVGFSEKDSEEFAKILTRCSLKDFNEKLVELEEKNHFDISEDVYNKAYTGVIFDDKVDEFRHINIYFKDNEIIYICSSNHMCVFYNKEDGVVNDSHRLFVN